jgi:signal recognition particle receptor subunit beta
MVFFNYATMQMAAKIVYYGPGLCGKTTNLHHIYGRTAPDSRGEMVSLETETDRTLFFDLLPLDVGVISGFKTRVQLYTVPGQVFYNTTRKLVLKGVDGVVFVADSQRAMREANLESFSNLRANLAEIGLDLEDLPLALQYNKRDLTSILSVEELEGDLNRERTHESYEASAIHGQGVFETLKAISRLTLRSLKKRMLGEERATPKATVAAGTPAPARAREAPAELPAAKPPPGRERAAEPRETAAAPLPKAPKTRRAAPAPEEVPLEIEFEYEGAAGAEPRPPIGAASEEISEVSFAETNGAHSGGEGVKHVRVGSNVDILAELERLRKNATSLSPAARPSRRAGSGISVDDLLANSLNHRKEVSRVFDLQVPRKELAAGNHVTVSLRFNDRNDQAIGEQKDFSVSLESAQNLEKFLLNLKFQIFGK